MNLTPFLSLSYLNRVGSFYYDFIVLIRHDNLAATIYNPILRFMNSSNWHPLFINHKFIWRNFCNGVFNVIRFHILIHTAVKVYGTYYTPIEFAIFFNNLTIAHLRFFIAIK